MLIVLFNYFTDSMSLFFKKNVIINAAKSIAHGKNVAGLYNYDDRLFQELLVKNFDTPIDAIAIGSSRTMQLRSRYISDSKINFFNNSVSGASLEDYMSIVQLYDTLHGYIPKTIILGIDPWVFNEHNGKTGYQSLIDYYNKMIENIGIKEKDSEYININNKWKQLINLDYTIENIIFLKKKFLDDKKRFYDVKNIDTDDFIKERDGSVHYPFSTRFSKGDVVRDKAMLYINPPVYSMQHFSKLSHTDKFNKFIEYLQRKGIKIIFFLPPYHPIVYKFFEKDANYKIVIEVEDYLRHYALENNITIVGSYNPSVFGFRNDDFFDGMHSHDNIPKTIFKKIAIQ